MRSRARIAALRADVRARQALLDDLADENLALRVRRSVLWYALRVMEEVVAHRARYGAAAGAAELESLRMLGTLFATPYAPGVLAGGGAAPVGAALEHLQPSRQLVGLDGLAPPDVLRAQHISLPQAAQQLERLVAAARGPAAAALDRGLDPNKAAPARAGLAAAGRAMRALLDPLIWWQPQLYWELSVRHLTEGHACVGEADAPQAAWDAIAASLGLCREQALLLIDNARLMEARVRRLEEQRAWLYALMASAPPAPYLSAPLAPRGTGGRPGGPAPGAGGHGYPPGGQPPGVAQYESLDAWSDMLMEALDLHHLDALDPEPHNRDAAAERVGGAGTGAPEWAAWPQDGGCGGGGGGGAGRPPAAALRPGLGKTRELLAVNCRCEQEVRLLHVQVAWSLLTDMQRAVLVCQAYPVPVNWAALVDSISYHLFTNADDMFPFVGRTEQMRPTRWRLASVGR